MATGHHEVISLSRGVQRGGHPYPVRNVHIDLLHPQGLSEVLPGVEAVVHAAGVLRIQKDRDWERTHVGTTINLLDACRRAGVRKIVYMSALGAHARAPSAYLKSKWDAEQAVENSGLAWTIFRPSLIFGVGDRVVSQLLGIARYSPLVPVFGSESLTVQPVWVGDVATAVVKAAMDPGTDGSVYELGGPQPMTIPDVIDVIKRGTGSASVPVRLPGFLSDTLVRLGEQLLSHPPVTEEQLVSLAAGGTCDPNPAAVTFGLRMRSLADVLPEYQGANR
jgi:uncharacterized protein YbjT (DUF2867 family)